MNMENYILEVENVSKTYYNHKALKNVSLKVQKGHIYGLLGPNGAGKTSLIRIITQITAADGGIVRFNGEELAPKHIAQIGYLPEERGLYKKMKVSEQLIYLAELKGLKYSAIEKKLEYWSEAFEMKSFWNKNVEDLSKGMQQKVQFVATVLHDPSLIILDEPFSGFDPVNAELLTSEILKLKNQGVTIIFSTHRMETVESLCDDIALINKSEKILEGTKSDIKKQFKKNEFELITAQKLDFSHSNFSLKAESMSELGFVYEISGENLSPNDLLHFALASTEVRAFAEKLPSMSDIFISLVGHHSEKEFV